MLAPHAVLSPDDHGVALPLPKRLPSTIVRGSAGAGRKRPLVRSGSMLGHQTRHAFILPDWLATLLTFKSSRRSSARSFDSVFAVVCVWDEITNASFALGQVKL